MRHQTTHGFIILINRIGFGKVSLPIKQNLFAYGCSHTGNTLQGV